MTDINKKKKLKPAFKLQDIIKTPEFSYKDFKFQGDDITNKWKIERELGEGRFKKAYIASRYENPTEKFALFQFRFDEKTLDSNKKEIKNFKQIMEYTKKNGCSHLVICPIDIGFHNKELTLVTSLFKGTNLDNYLKNNCFNVEFTIELMLQIMKGVQFLHTKLHFLHFDLKPDNIQIHTSKKKVSKGQEIEDIHIGIMDIGSGCFRDEILKEECEFGGTEMYAAPEVLTVVGRKNLQYIWEKIDIYSCGIVFKEIIEKVLQCNKLFLESSEKILLSQIDKTTKRLPIRRGSLVKKNDKLIQELQKLQKSMSNFNYELRPTSTGVINTLLTLQKQQPLSNRRESLF